MKQSNNPIIRLIEQTQGIDLSKYEDVFLNKTVQKRMNDTFCGSENAYCTFLEQSQSEREIFLHSLEISYTEFFRNSLTFSVLEKIILPSILMKKLNSNKNEIRIWCAACAAGQETYSLAILIKELSNGYMEKINFRIFATDQSESQIHEAQQGIYPESAVGNLSLKRLNKWFTKQGNNYHVNHELKEDIEFSVFDLFNDKYSCPPASIFGDFDLIVCANLLFYYNPDYQQKIIKKTNGSLSKNGFLVAGEAERNILLHSGLIEVYPQSVIFQL